MLLLVFAMIFTIVTIGCKTCIEGKSPSAVSSRLQVPWVGPLPRQASVQQGLGREGLSNSLNGGRSRGSATIKRAKMSSVPHERREGARPELQNMVYIRLIDPPENLLGSLSHNCPGRWSCSDVKGRLLVDWWLVRHLLVVCHLWNLLSRLSCSTPQRHALKRKT